MLYARRDVRHLLYIADCLGQELLALPQHKAKHEEEQQLAAEAAATEAPALAAAAAAAAGVAPASPRAAASTSPFGPAAAGPAASSSTAEANGSAPQQAQAGRRPRGGEVVELIEPQAGPPPSIVELSPEAQQALAAAMAVPHGRLERTVYRSQALTLTLHQPTPPAAAVAAAAAGLMRRHVAAALEQHARLTATQVNHLETVADCVHALASWRDAAARQADEGLQCLLPDAELLRLAEAAAGSVAPEASNLRGRAQRITERQLLELLPSAAAAGSAAASGPAAPVTPDVPAEGLGVEAVQGQAKTGAEAAGEVANRAAPAEAGSNGTATAASGAAGNGTPGSCGCWPTMLRRDVAAVAAALSEAAAGQRPWVCREVQELLQDAAGGGAGALGKPNSNGGGGNKAARRRDPAAFRQKQAAKFAAKSTVGGHVCWQGKRICMEGGHLVMGGQTRHSIY